MYLYVYVVISIYVSICIALLKAAQAIAVKPFAVGVNQAPHFVWLDSDGLTPGVLVVGVPTQLLPRSLVLGGHLHLPIIYHKPLSCVTTC